MKENVLEVLIYLFENYMVEGSIALQSDQSTLTDELVEAGFGQGEINQAFLWLDGLLTLSDQRAKSSYVGKGIRCYRLEERARISVEAQSLLLRLERAGVLDASSRELVIDRIMALGIASVDIEYIKWIVMMVLCNQNEYNEMIEWAEGLVTGASLLIH